MASTAELLLHPVRLRIVQAFLGDRALTTSQLSAELADIPPTSLYRHVARLVSAGVLQVVAERRVRGALERTYVLRAAAASINPSEAASMTREEHRRAFLAFVAGLLADADRYLQRDEIDPARDGVSYQLAGLWLSDTEYATMLGELTRVFQPLLANAPRADRKRRILAAVLLLGDDAPDDAGSGAMNVEIAADRDRSGAAKQAQPFTRSHRT